MTALCTGDCNNDLAVRVNELVLGVGIALDRTPLSECPSFDVNRNLMVSINELVEAVNNALRGCP
jgi:hypothetical protein